MPDMVWGLAAARTIWGTAICRPPPGWGMTGVSSITNSCSTYGHCNRGKGDTHRMLAVNRMVAVYQLCIPVILHRLHESNQYLKGSA